jgi:carboxylesterase
VVPVSCPERELAGVSGQESSEILLHEGCDVATLDSDAPRIFEESVQFIEQLGQSEFVPPSRSIQTKGYP